MKDQRIEPPDQPEPAELTVEDVGNGKIIYNFDDAHVRWVNVNRDGSIHIEHDYDTNRMVFEAKFTKHEFDTIISERQKLMELG